MNVDLMAAPSRSWSKFYATRVGSRRCALHSKFSRPAPNVVRADRALRSLRGDVVPIVGRALAPNLLRSRIP